MRNRVGSSHFRISKSRAAWMRRAGQAAALLAFHACSAWLSQVWLAPRAGPVAPAPVPRPASPPAAPAPAPPARGCPAVGPPTPALAEELCVGLERCWPVPAPPLELVCPDPCPACPEPVRNEFSWGFEVSFGLLSLLLWELASRCLRAAGLAIRRGCRRRPQAAFEAEPREDLAALPADLLRRVGKGRGRLTTANRL